MSCNVNAMRDLNHVTATVPTNCTSAKGKDM